MKKVSKLLEEVRRVLALNKEARNNDVKLIKDVLLGYYRQYVQFGTKTGKAFIDLDNEEAVAMFSKIERCRRKVQETEYMPTDWKVAKRRRIAEATWRAYMTFNN